MILSKENIKAIGRQGKVEVPGETYFNLPEKVLQFGTGVLLRGLTDYFIDQANRQGIFNGRIVVVKSTGYGDAAAFSQQDGMYTLCIRGIENGEPVEDTCLNASISRVLSASADWDKIMDCASNPDLQVIVSNTTEVGIVLDEQDDIFLNPPKTFPAKLLAFLYKRFGVCNGSAEGGMVIIPTELITDNGQTLKAIVLSLATRHALGDAFLSWLEKENYFCNSLVDRIVPGKLSSSEKMQVEEKLGYEDDLLIMAEPYRLWAIESVHETVNRILSFSSTDKGVVISGDISRFRELKLRLLNGPHSFSCGLAVLAGFKTVKEAMANAVFNRYVSQLMLDEIVPVVSGNQITIEAAKAFRLTVIDRFCNPYIEHAWLSISLQYTSKMRMRNIPLLKKHYEIYQSVPRLMTLGFAGYLLFSRPGKIENGGYLGNINGHGYTIQDDKIQDLYKKWQAGSLHDAVKNIMSDTNLWGTDLNALPGFAEQVINDMESIRIHGVRKTMEMSYEG